MTAPPPPSKLGMPAKSGPKPVVVVDPTVFQRGDFSKLKEISAGDCFMHGTPALIPPSFSQEDWFMYFWREAQNSWTNYAQPNDVTEALAFFNKGFTKPADWAQKPRVIPRGRFDTVYTDTELCSFFELCLRVGFESFPVAAVGAKADTSTDQGRYLRMHQKKIAFEIRWRTEGFRDLATLKAAGYKSQALDDNRKSAINCDKAWHPFSKPANNQQVWYRRMSQDNEWYSVVSVALNWKTSVCYPKIDQTPRLQLLKQGQVIDKTLRDAHPDLFGDVEFMSGEVEAHMITRSKMALFLVDGMVFDTQGKQAADKGKDEAYPEQGVSCVEGRNVMGMVEFVRVHHGHDDEAGFTAIMDRRASQAAFNEQFTADALLLAIGNKEATIRIKKSVEDAWDSAYSSPQVHLKWAKDGFGILSGPKSTRQVKKITLANGKVVYP